MSSLNRNRTSERTRRLLARHNRWLELSGRGPTYTLRDQEPVAIFVCVFCDRRTTWTDLVGRCRPCHEEGRAGRGRPLFQEVNGV